MQNKNQLVHKLINIVISACFISSALIKVFRTFKVRYFLIFNSPNRYFTTGQNWTIWRKKWVEFSESKIIYNYYLNSVVSKNEFYIFVYKPSHIKSFPKQLDDGYKHPKRYRTNLYLILCNSFRYLFNSTSLLSHVSIACRADWWCVHSYFNGNKVGNQVVF